MNGWLAALSLCLCSGVAFNAMADDQGAAPQLVQPQSDLPCWPLDQAIALFKSRYGESEIARGVVIGMPLMMITTESPRTKTWTIFMVNAKGIACAVSAGADYTPAALGAPI